MEHLIGKAKLADVMIEPRRGYVSYLLRLWQVNIKGETVWRASIKSAHTGELRGFASLDDLCLYLLGQTWMLSNAEKVEDRTQ